MSEFLLIIRTCVRELGLYYITFLRGIASRNKTEREECKNCSEWEIDTAQPWENDIFTLCTRSKCDWLIHEQSEEVVCALPLHRSRNGKYFLQQAHLSSTKCVHVSGVLCWSEGVEARHEAWQRGGGEQPPLDYHPCGGGSGGVGGGRAGQHIHEVCPAQVVEGGWYDDESLRICMCLCGCTEVEFQKNGCPIVHPAKHAPERCVARLVTCESPIGQCLEASFSESRRGLRLTLSASLPSFPFKCPVLSMPQ
eukprot:6489288-Amphidinium_carterae.1